MQDPQGTLRDHLEAQDAREPTHDHAAHEELVLAEQVKQIFATAPIGFAATFINSLIVFIVARDVLPYPAVAYWLVAIWLLTALRVVLAVWYRKSPFDPKMAPIWKRRFIGSLVVIGTAWGSVGLFPFAEVSLAHQVFLAFVLGGMAAGASSTFSPVRHGYAAYAVPALGPLIIHFLLLSDMFHWAMAGMLLLFGGLLWKLSLHNFTVNRTSLLLRYENREMIARLKAEIEAKLKAEAELKQYHEHLERLVEERTARLSMVNKELEQFAFVASHDLKAPLRAVANLALVIDEDVSEGLDPENRKRLKLLRERVRRMDALIEGMLAYARLGQTSATTASVAVAGVLAELCGELPLPEGFAVEWEPPLPSLNADPVHVRQIFQNLVGNAIQHHDRTDGHVWVRARDMGDHWELDVADDGPGIQEPNREKVFHLFAAGSRTGHTGIGLAVVRKLALGYGATVQALPNHPRGTIFRIAWPK